MLGKNSHSSYIAEHALSLDSEFSYIPDDASVPIDEADEYAS